MANDYIINKWRQWFKMIDINHRGEISKADVSDEGETFANLSRMNDDQKTKVKETLYKLWDDIVFRGRAGAINEEEFVEMNTKLYTTDKSKFQDEIRKTKTTIFTDIVDTDNDGFITEDDFVNIMRACGNENILLNKKFFSLYNPEDGKVPVQAFIDSWVQFTCSDDSSTRGIIKEGIETCE